MATKKKTLEQRFYAIVEGLFQELDQDSVMAEVQALRKKKPKHSREQIAAELIKRTARKTALVGATAGVPGGAFGLLAAAPDIFNLVRSQSRLVLSIAFLYDQKPGLEERFKEVLAVLALSTGASATRQGVRHLIAKGLTGKTAEAVMKRVAGRYMARKLPAIAPLVGSVAGAGLNYMAVQGTGKIAIEYYSSELERSGKDQKVLDEQTETEPPAKRTSSRGVRAKKSSSAKKAGASKKAPAKKRASRKSSKSNNGDES